MAGAGPSGVAGLTGRDGFSNTNRQSPADPGFAFFSAFSAVAGACGDLQLFDPGDFVEPIDRVAAISQQTQSYLQFCGCDSQSCVADALDKYADALEQAAAPPPPNPPRLRALLCPAQNAARGARIAEDRPRGRGARARRGDAARGGRHRPGSDGEGAEENRQDHRADPRVRHGRRELLRRAGPTSSPIRSSRPPKRWSAPTRCETRRARRDDGVQ